MNYFSFKDFISNNDKTHNKLKIKITDYEYESNIINCKLFQSQNTLNEGFGIDFNELVSDKIIEEEQENDNNQQDLEITNEVVGVSTWSGDLHIKLLMNKSPYISKNLQLCLPSGNRFCGGCTDFEFWDDFLSADTDSVKLGSSYGNGIVRLWSLGNFSKSQFV